MGWLIVEEWLTVDGGRLMEEVDREEGRRVDGERMVEKF
jgi:hypothetical protein